MKITLPLWFWLQMEQVSRLFNMKLIISESSYCYIANDPTEMPLFLTEIDELVELMIVTSHHVTSGGSMTPFILIKRQQEVHQLMVPGETLCHST